MTHPVRDLAHARPPRRTILRDGTAVVLQEVSAGAQTALRDFLECVSAESLRLRFCGGVERDRAAACLADCSRPGDLAFLARVGGEPTIAAHAASYRLAADRAEVAFLVANAWQGRGLGAVLFAHLADSARGQGVETLVADVLPANAGMLAVFERSGYPVEIRPGGNLVHVRIELATAARAAVA